jgi:CubicO group peptidase (beta-lactamase class C family)
VTNKLSLYAPTEECPVRRKLVQGEVHDLNAWALGGVSTHAGLFGSIDDVGWFSLHLRSHLLGIARYSIRQKTAQLFAKRALPEGHGDWAMGYMMPTPGAASCGTYFSLDSIGHTGFTGTSVWYDPKMDLSVCILSNRVLYGADNKAFGKLRPEIHNWIVENYRRSGL